ncbi:cytochrome P450 [Burkholderia sp. SCN-KJ]|uniref:cytochrome P450 n=1 Tax=Burkholderia sp. SCN-KJ TaxID=2969248 RepID=UPI00214F6660|nr:cytochrome P450 [Burkholderia sp. SCN-KJ]MCR4468600.1 cytochrome P450 [Burkholderia sp. SCN-KJ]
MVYYDPYDRELMKNPWDAYRQLRDEAPAYFMEKYDAWVLSRFDDIQKASLDRENYTAKAGIATGNLLQKRLIPDSSTFMSMDPPEHTGFRKAVASAFRPTEVQARLPAFIAERIETYGAPLLSQREFDAVKAFALPVATDVAAHLTGIPLEDGPMLVKWVEVFEPFFHDIPPQGTSDTSATSADAAGGQLIDYFLRLVDRHRKQGPSPENVIGMLLLADIDGHRLDDLTVAQNALPLFIGGMETFPKHFGSLLYWLAEFPEQRAKVASNRALCGKAVEEAMRFDAPAPMLGRRAVNAVTWHGHTIQPGQAVMFLYQAANRDDRIFERPDEFDVERSSIPQVAFGSGIHVCLGMHAARIESRMMLEWLLSHAHDYKVDKTRAVRGLLAGMHGFRSLFIEV